MAPSLGMNPTSERLIDGGSMRSPSRRASCAKPFSLSVLPMSSVIEAAMNSVGVIGFEISRLIGDQRVSGGVRLVEAVAREFRHQLEDILGAAAVDAVGDRALDEALLLRRHLLLDLLAHGAAQQIRLAERKARQNLRDLHHLLLVDDDAVGLIEDRRDQSDGASRSARGRVCGSRRNRCCPSGPGGRARRWR